MTAMGGNGFIIKTPSEQRLEHLEQLKRPLTPDESAELQRALHANYVRGWRKTREHEPA
jgi:hypothetical protein